MLVLLPALPGYLLARQGTLGSLGERYPNLARVLKALPTGLEVATEMNLAIFYMSGTYYDLVKRVFGIRHVCHLNHWPVLSEPPYTAVVHSGRPAHPAAFLLSARRFTGSQAPA